MSHTPGSTDESWKISDENSNVIRFENQQEAVNAFKNAYLKESFKRDIEIGNFNFNGVFSGETSSREDFIKETIIIVNNSNTKIGLINMYNFLNKLDPNKNINYGLYRGSNPRSGGRSKEQTEKENKELLDEFKTYIKKL